MFIAALFIIARKWEQLKCLSTDGIDKQNVEYHAMGYNSTTKRSKAGLPWWRSGWESACQCRGHGFVPRSGKIPHAAERLGP